MSIKDVKNEKITFEWEKKQDRSNTYYISKDCMITIMRYPYKKVLLTDRKTGEEVEITSYYGNVLKNASHLKKYAEYIFCQRSK